MTDTATNESTQQKTTDVGTTSAATHLARLEEVARLLGQHGNSALLFNNTHEVKRMQQLIESVRWAIEHTAHLRIIEAGQKAIGRSRS